MGGRTRAFDFLLASALLSGYLAFDDGFLLHEELALRYLALGSAMSSQRGERA